MFFTEASTQTATVGSNSLSSAMEMFVLVVPLMLVWYFLLIRPQRQQIKQRAEMLKSIRRGDYVITGGGIAAKVTKVIDDTEIEVEIAEGIRVRVIRSFISDIRSKTEPVK